MRKVCVDCAHKCLSVHGKKTKSSTPPSSFFKVMIGSDFSTVLYLPPKFGPTASTLVDKEVTIEDSSGNEWTVQISIVDKSYAFKDGWEAFSLEHGLEVGNFLVFHYMGRSHFVVKIFDKSACEKIHFPNQRKEKKRKTIIRIDPESSDEFLKKQGLLSLESQDEVEEINSNSKGRFKSLFKDKTYEDPCYLKDQDFGDTGPMFDGLRDEILNNSCVNGTVGKFRSSNEMVVSGICTTKDPLLEEMLVDKGAIKDPFEVELTIKRSHFLEELDKSTLLSCERHTCETKVAENLLITFTMEHEETKENNFSSTPNWEEDKKCQFAEKSETEAKEGYPMHAGNCGDTIGFHVSLEDVPMCHVTGIMERMIQKELMDMASNVFSDNDQLKSIIGDQDNNLNSVKAEPSDCGAAHMLAPISEATSQDNAALGSREETMAVPLQ